MTRTQDQPPPTPAVLPTPEQALACLRAGRLKQAESAFRRLAELAPDRAQPLLGLALALARQDKTEAALQTYRKAVALDPTRPEVHFNMGNLLRALGRADEAARAFEAALDCKPDMVQALVNLGAIHQMQGRLGRAEACYRQAAAAAAESPEQAAHALGNLATVLKTQGRIEEAVAEARRSVALNPRQARLHSNLLTVLACDPGCSAEDLFAEYRAWGLRHAPARAAPDFPNGPDPDRRLRVGLLAGNLGRHPEGWFSAAALEAMDKAHVTFIVYDARTRPAGKDPLTARIGAAIPLWRPVGALEDAGVAEAVRRDGVDILIEMSGHFEGGRIPVLGHRPAPVQAAWLGHNGTTGAGCVDWFLTDALETPPGLEHLFTERVLRLAESFVCYTPPEDAPESGPLPMAANGYVTLGCMNNPGKLNRAVAALWARVLDAVPDSRLLLCYEYYRSETVRRHILALFTEAGVAPARVRMTTPSAQGGMLRAHALADMALDPFPHSGALTTAESLWMGVPVLTLPGRSFASRHSASLVTNAGLPDWVVDDPQAYVERARAWAAKPDALADVRASLRRRVQEAPLCDAPRFARHFHEALRHMWRDWCARGE